MSKVKIVQIALTSAADGAGGADIYGEYLDDKGRVWYQARVKDEPTDAFYLQWRQLELPDEPPTNLTENE
jgi:folate-binding Fe-S cluster repair protein YgfZ